MHSTSRKLLALYLAASTGLAPIIPAFAASPQKQNLPELGSKASQDPTPNAPLTAEPASDWLERAATDSDLAPGAVRDHHQGVDQAIALGGGILSGAASEATENWFQAHHITAEMALKVDNNGVHGGNLDILVPVYNAGKDLVFMQDGIRRSNTYSEDARNTANLGLGYRRDMSGWLLGANTFYDRDFTGQHDRLTVGVEAWTDFFKLSANHYLPLSNWKNSTDSADLLERPSEGFDVRAEGYLPAHPQLGATLAYEQYQGEHVSLSSTQNGQKDPKTLTAGLTYNPIPLVGVSIDHRFGGESESENTANLTFTYRIGESLAKQLSPDGIMAKHLLANMRYDLVSRNNEMVLDHQEKILPLTLPAALSGASGNVLPFAVSGANGLSALTWLGGAAAFASPLAGDGQARLTLPAYVTGGDNTYTLQATGIARSGRMQTSNVMTVTVQPTNVAAAKIQTPATATTSASLSSIAANGQSNSTITSVIKDAKGNPVGEGVEVKWTTTGGTLSGQTSTTDKDGNATIILTSPTQPGSGTVEATAGAAKGSATVTFTPGAAATATSLTATPSSITANGTSTSTITTVIKDANGNPVAEGVEVKWTTTGGKLSNQTALTGKDGKATIVLTSPTTVGTGTVEATSGTAKASTTVTFAPGDAATVAAPTASPSSIPANGTSTSTIRTVIKDANGNTVGKGVEVKWTTTGGTLSSQTSTTDKDGNATIVLTSPTQPGSGTVEATSGAAKGSTIVDFVPGAAATATTPTASPSSIPADGTSTSTVRTVIKDANGNPVGKGVEVKWTTTGGTLDNATSTTDKDGVATVVLTSSTTVGAGTVEAISGAAKASTTVTFTPGAAATATAPTASPSSIPADGTSKSTISTVIKDANGNPVGKGVEVKWTTTGGTLDNATSTTDKDGVATVVLTSSTTVGAGIVEAISGAAKASTTVTFTPGAAATATAPTASPSSIPADGTSKSTISTVIKDANGNPVGKGVEVKWTTTGGSLDNPTSTTDKDGVATVVVTSPTQPGSGTVEATSGAAKASTTVTFTPGAAATATAPTASPSSIPADGTSKSTISTVIKDANGNPVGKGVEVKWTTTGGTLDNATSTTDKDGIAQVTLTSPTSVGSGTVEATSGAAKGSTTVTFTPGAAATATAPTASPSSIPADGTSKSTISTVIKDANGNPVGKGLEVKWTTTGGSLDNATSTTDKDGVATVVVTSPTTVGSGIIEATSGAAKGSTTVTFTPGAVATITAPTASPSSIPADGTSKSTISTVIKDANGNPVGKGVEVKWTTTGGSLDNATSTTDKDGVATVNLTSPTTVGSGTVEATSGAAKASTTVTFTPGAAATVTAPTASPSSIPADGTSKSTISTVIKDASGNPVGKGVEVKWTTTGGTLDNPTSTTNKDGVATIVLTSSTTVGTGTVEATSGAAKASTTVAFTARAAATVSTLTASPPSLPADGTSKSTIRAVITDANGKPVDKDVEVKWRTTGGMLNTGTSTTDEDGVATVTLTSQWAVGSGTVSATSGAATASTTVNFVPGDAATATVPTASPPSITADGNSTSTIRTVIKDANRNPVGKDVEVKWTTTGGSLDNATSTTDKDGVATVVLTSPTKTGSGTVEATSGVAKASVTVAFTPGAAATATAPTALPSSIPANGTSQSTLSTVIKDANGNPVGKDVEVQWTTTGGALDNATSTTDKDGVATVNLTSPTTAGSGTVEATSGAAKASATVTFAVQIANIQVTSLPDKILPDGVSSTTLTALVTDVSGKPVAAGTVVKWDISASSSGQAAGTLSGSSSTTNDAGVATIGLTGSTFRGTNTVRASAGAVVGSSTVTSAVTLTLSTSSDNIAPGEKFTVTVKATGPDGSPAPGIALAFVEYQHWTTLSSPTATTDSNGSASVELTRVMPIYFGSPSVHINAFVGGTSQQDDPDYITVNFPTY